MTSFIPLTRKELDSLDIRNLNGDYRRDPKTKSFCECCQKDIKEGEKYVKVSYITYRDGLSAQSCFPIAIEDEFGEQKVGLTCWKKNVLNKVSVDEFIRMMSGGKEFSIGRINGRLASKIGEEIFEKP